MEPVIRGLLVYVFLLMVFRIAGKRTLSEATSFDLVLALIISETVQQAMVDGDHSMTTGMILVLTLVAADIGLSLIKQRLPAVETIIEGKAVLVVDNGRLVESNMKRERIDSDDILEAAREQRGIEDFDQIKYAVVERGGHITIVPK
jgi:uncharacterized membrane protein YcaP (DUF421 family)